MRSVPGTCREHEATDQSPIESLPICPAVVIIVMYCSESAVLRLITRNRGKRPKNGGQPRLQGSHLGRRLHCAFGHYWPLPAAGECTLTNTDNSALAPLLTNCALLLVSQCNLSLNCAYHRVARLHIPYKMVLSITITSHQPSIYRAWNFLYR